MRSRYSLLLQVNLFELGVYTYNFKTFGPVPMGLELVVQKRKIQYDKRWKQNKSKDHLFIYFQNNNNGNSVSDKTAIVFLYFFNFIPFLLLYIFFFSLPFSF